MPVITINIKINFNPLLDTTRTLSNPPLYGHARKTLKFQGKFCSLRIFHTFLNTSIFNEKLDEHIEGKTLIHNLNVQSIHSLVRIDGSLIAAATSMNKRWMKIE